MRQLRDIFRGKVSLVGNFRWSRNKVGEYLGGDREVAANHFEVILFEGRHRGRSDAEVFHKANFNGLLYLADNQEPEGY